jgi:hypothetical protein
MRTSDATLDCVMQFSFSTEVWADILSASQQRQVLNKPVHRRSSCNSESPPTPCVLQKIQFNSCHKFRSRISCQPKAKPRPRSEGPSHQWTSLKPPSFPEVIWYDIQLMTLNCLVMDQSLVINLRRGSVTSPRLSPGSTPMVPRISARPPPPV